VSDFLPTDWSKSTIGSFAEVKGGKRLPKGDMLQSVPTSHPYIRLVDIENNRVSDGDLLFLSPETYSQISRYIVRAHDVCLAIVGHTIGLAFYVDEKWDSANLTENAARITNMNGVIPKYLFFFLTSPQGKSQIKSRTVGSAQGKLPLYNIKSIELPLPPLPEQRAIAHILGTLDDKIENNRKMNETLGAMARAVFKSWFVDFDPVRAKMEGRQPVGMDAETAALFPHSFEDSALGKIPKGWETGVLEQVIDVIETGSRPKGGVKGIDSGVPSIGAESIVRLGHFDFGKTKFVPRKFFTAMNRGKIEDRDVLLYKDGGRPGEYEPHVSMFGEGFPFQEFCINEHVYRIRANHLASQPYVYFWLTSDVMMDEMRVKGTGVAIPGLNSTSVKSLTTLIPNVEVTNRFEQTSERFLGKVFVNCNESRELAKVRDVLLPKLLSGEIRVKEADKWAKQDRLEQVVAEAEEEKKPAKRVVKEQQPRRNEPEEEFVQACFEGVDETEEEGLPQTVPLHEIDTDEAMAVIRKTLREHGEIQRTDLLRDVAQCFGYKRLGSRIEDAFKGHLRAAIRRKIASGNTETVWLETTTMAEYSPDELIDSLRSVMRKNLEYEREEVIEAVARHLGFSRVRDTVRAPIKSAINAAIRRGVLAYKGQWIWREQ
jgi:type I restriction enzyme, S subunit